MPERNAPIAHTKAIGYAWGILAPLICTLIAWPARHWLGPASILITYLLGVFLVASRYGSGASILASLLSAPAFAFYFARPLFSFAIHDLENIIGLTIMIVVSNVTGRLLERSQHQTELEQQRLSRANALYHLSRDLADARLPSEVTTIVVKHINDDFSMSSALLLTEDIKNQQYLAGSLIAADEFDATSALHTLETNTLVRKGRLTYYPLASCQTRQGILVIQECNALTLPTGELQTFIVTLCHLIGQTLDRLLLANQARDSALQADAEALRNALLSSISHDLRTPLTRILGAAGTVLEGYPEIPHPARLDLQVVLDEAQRMAELTDKLLNMAKLSSGQIVLHRGWNTIEEIVGAALNRLYKLLTDRPVRTLLPDSLPLLWIDAVLMEQVMVNLIENAIKYTPAGSPIDIEGSTSSEYVRLAIVDYGPGIAEQLKDKLFEKFYRGNPESEQAGVGLGLTLCKAIVEAHGGSITAGNRNGKGAEFIIELPLPHEPPGNIPKTLHDY